VVCKGYVKKSFTWKNFDSPDVIKVSKIYTIFLIKSTNSVIKITWRAHGGISKIFFLDHFSS
jgi:hypothetical protein